jgi:hypothetical protein
MADSLASAVAMLDTYDICIIDEEVQETDYSDFL